MYKLSVGERLFKYGNILFLGMLSLAFVIPFYMVLVSSFITEAEAARRGSFILWPQQISLAAYGILFQQSTVLVRSFMISIFRVVVGTGLSMLATSMFAFGLARRQLPGRRLILRMIFFTMIFSGGLIPGYLLVKSLGLIDRLWSMVVPSLISTGNLILMKNFFLTIPESLEESATLDGATPLRTLLSIIIPVSIPMIVTIGMFYAVGHWNAWFDATIYIHSPEKYPLQVVLRIVLQSNNDNLLLQGARASMETYAKPPQETMRSALIVFTTLPILCVYPFVQRYFIKGIMIGSIKA